MQILSSRETTSSSAFSCWWAQGQNKGPISPGGRGGEVSVLTVQGQRRAFTLWCLHRNSAGSQRLLWAFLLPRQVPGELSWADIPCLGRQSWLWPGAGAALGTAGAAPGEDVSSVHRRQHLRLPLVLVQLSGHGGHGQPSPLHRPQAQTVLTASPSEPGPHRLTRVPFPAKAAPTCARWDVPRAGLGSGVPWCAQNRSQEPLCPSWCSAQTGPGDPAPRFAAVHSSGPWQASPLQRAPPAAAAAALLPQPAPRAALPVGFQRWNGLLPESPCLPQCLLQGLLARPSCKATLCPTRKCTQGAVLPLSLWWDEPGHDFVPQYPG